MIAQGVESWELGWFLVLTGTADGPAVCEAVAAGASRGRHESIYDLDYSQFKRYTMVFFAPGNFSHRVSANGPAFIPQTSNFFAPQREATG